MSSSNTSTKKTTFLTSDPRGRPPSAYHVKSDGQSQRARQGHNGGAALTREKHAVHAFTPDKVMRDVVRSNVKRSVASQGYSTQFALRLEIMDGLASPVAQSGNAHQEAFPGFKPTHKSGGYVAFPEPDSRLANFDLVAHNTRRRERDPSIPAITDSQSTAQTRESVAFNSQALSDQQAFTRRFLK